MAVDHLGRIKRAEGGDHRLAGALQIVGVEAQRRLHRHLRGDLEQMGHHHVEERAGGVIEDRPVIDVQRLGDVDLDLLDVLPVPHAGHHAVGEPEYMQVLGALLTQEVVDPVDLLLIEHVVYGDIELPEVVR